MATVLHDFEEAEVEKMVTRHGFVKKQTVDIGAYNYLMTFL